MSPFYFFLDHPDNSLNSSVDLFSFPSTNLLTKHKSKNLYIHAFYSDGKKWIIKNIGTIKRDSQNTLRKEELDSDFKDKSVFICLSEKEKISLCTSESEKVSSFEAYPPWRSNIKIKGEFMSTSYQGEIPNSFLDLKPSLVSCSPMFQMKEDVENFFYLVNIQRNPEKNKFKVKIFDLEEKKIGELDCLTNCINLFNLNNILNKKENMMIFTSEEYGGIPLYSSKDKKSEFLSLEHTHPPIEHIYMGNRFYFQKKKKTHWFKT